MKWPVCLNWSQATKNEDSTSVFAGRYWKIKCRDLIGVPLCAGIPLTRRLTARRLQFITGHDVRGALPQDLNLAALADPLATTVVFMGQRTFPALARMLIDAGLPADTACLFAEGVSTPQQKLHRITITDLAERPTQSISDAPALILYGALSV